MEGGGRMEERASKPQSENETVALAAREERGRVAETGRYKRAGGEGSGGGVGCIRHGPTGGWESGWGRRRVLLIEQLS